MLDIILKISITYYPKGNKIKSIISPDKEKIVNVYFIDGGPISSNAIRIEIESIKNEIVKNIYYDYYSYTKNMVKVKWIDNNNILINSEIIKVK